MPKNTKPVSVGDCMPLTGLEIGEVKAYTYFLTIQLEGTYANGSKEHAELTLDFTELPHQFERAQINDSRKSKSGPVVIVAQE